MTTPLVPIIFMVVMLVLAGLLMWLILSEKPDVVQKNCVAGGDIVAGSFTPRTTHPGQNIATIEYAKRGILTNKTIPDRRRAPPTYPADRVMEADEVDSAPCPPTVDHVPCSVPDTSWSAPDVSSPSSCDTSSSYDGGSSSDCGSSSGGVGSD